MVEGFDELDFLPNIFEYMNYKTVAGQKALTRSEVELQLLRKEIQDDPQMQTRMQRELDYVLNRTSEAAGVRKAIFYYYLGASVRHMFQNMMQIPLNGIPEMVAQGGGVHSYKHLFTASKLAAKYLKDGTTGDKTFDVLLKEAEKEGTTIPNAIEFFAPESNDLQIGLDSVAKFSTGKASLGEKAAYGASQLGKGMEKFLRSTAAATEQANRRISFIMSLLESKRRGQTDLRKMYNDAASFTDYVNFVGDKSNRPGFQVKLGQSWAHSPVLVATALQSFVLNHVGQLYSYGRLAMRGDANYKRAFATGVAHLLFFSGVFGMVGAQTAEQLFESITGISLKTALREKIVLGAELFDIQEQNGGRIADTVMHGFPTLLGVDASQSLGLGDLMFKYQAGQDTSALDILGPLGGMVEKTGRGLDKLSADPFAPQQWLEATRAVAPQALNYWFRLSDAMYKGSYLDSQGLPVVQNLDGKSSASLLAGFTPREVSKVREIQAMRYKENQRIDSEYRNAVDITAKALVEYQRTGNPEALLRANQAFSGYVTEMAGTQDRGSMVKTIAERMNRLETGDFNPPTLKENRRLAEVLSAYPDTEYRFADRLPVLANELKVAQSLGQQDVLLQRLSGLQTAALTSVLYDSLVQAGFDPATAALLSQRGKSGRQRLTEIAASRGQTAQASQAVQ